MCFIVIAVLIALGLQLLLLIVLGIACNAMSNTVGGSHVQEFISGLLIGLSVAEVLAGIVVVGRSVLKR